MTVNGRPLGGAVRGVYEGAYTTLPGPARSLQDDGGKGVLSGPGQPAGRDLVQSV